jgi:hypothetical protein
LGKEAQERDLEEALLNHLREFLLELGVGFAVVGSQYHLEVGDQDFYEYAGKTNFYLSAVDDLLKHAEDGPSIGIVLCKENNRVIVEYDLKGSLPTIEELEAEPEGARGDGDLSQLGEHDMKIKSVARSGSQLSAAPPSSARHRPG